MFEGRGRGGGRQGRGGLGNVGWSGVNRDHNGQEKQKRKLVKVHLGSGEFGALCRLILLLQLKVQLQVYQESWSTSNSEASLMDMN